MLKGKLFPLGFFKEPKGSGGLFEWEPIHLPSTNSSFEKSQIFHNQKCFAYYIPKFK
jgi:hypothetical protein